MGLALRSALYPRAGHPPLLQLRLEPQSPLCDVVPGDAKQPGFKARLLWSVE